MLQFFTDCQCIFNPSISVWVKNGSLGDFFSFNIGEEHGNEFRAFVSHIISFFSIWQVLRQFCWNSSVWSYEKHLYCRFATLSHVNHSFLLLGYLGQRYQSVHTWSTHRHPANDCKGALILVFVGFMTIFYNLVPTRMLILPYTGQSEKYCLTECCTAVLLKFSFPQQGWKFCRNLWITVEINCSIDYLLHSDDKTYLMSMLWFAVLLSYSTLLWCINAAKINCQVTLVILSIKHGLNITKALEWINL